MRYVLSLDELIVKGGGSGNLIKSYTTMYQSKNVYEIWIGTGVNRGVIIVRYLRQKMKVVYDDTSKISGGTSSIMFTYANDPLKNDNAIPVTFNDKELGVVCRCNNIYGQRCISFCSHAITGMQYVYNMYTLCI